MESKKSFTEIYNAYYKRAFYFVKSYVHDEVAAEDIASEALIKLWEQIKIKDVDDYVAPLLLAILKNKSLDYLKHEEVKRNALENIADWYSYERSIRISSLEACNPDDIFSNDVQRIVQEVLEKMPVQTREIFMLSRFDNQTNAEISAKMDISTKSVEYHITKVLKVLRVALKDYLPIFFFLFA